MGQRPDVRARVGSSKNFQTARKNLDGDRGNTFFKLDQRASEGPRRPLPDRRSAQSKKSTRCKRRESNGLSPFSCSPPVDRWVSAAPMLPTSTTPLNADAHDASVRLYLPQLVKILPLARSLSGRASGDATLIGRTGLCMVRPRSRPGFASVLGRSQVVRQRILIPPSPGSNPGAPASANPLI